MMNFCTLFDSYYIDKGITLAKSFNKVCRGKFNLFIFCFDDKSKQVLTDLNIEGVTVLSHKDLENEFDILNKLKKERSKAEYCWTCTPASIEYVLNHYDVDSCTYIDADLYFFDTPEILFNELTDSVTLEKKNIIITPHRFTNSLKDRRFLNRSGKYCVEFNYFDKSDNARKALTWWREKCFEWCFHLYEKDRMGDQKYLEKFPELFDGVTELKNKGGGMAPWNLAQYQFAGYEDEAKERITIREKATGEIFKPVFYHFQDIRYLPGRKANLKSNSHDKILKYALYKPYLKAVEETRAMLKEKYDIDFSLKKAYASNKIIAFLQKNILQYKIKSLSDIVKLDEL